jgi:hypothetical protein
MDARENERTAQAPRPPAFGARKLAFVLVAAWIALSPAYVQLFGGKTQLVHAWRMYHLRGIGICAAEYFQRDARIDRYGLFGLDRKSAPDAFRRITDVRQARAMGEQICLKLRALDAEAELDVRVRLRCGVLEGLRTLLDREENLCGS